jgi:hypothetical protein
MVFLNLVLMICIGLVSAADIYVNQDIGDDRADGRTQTVSGGSAPLKTINLAIARSRPGDTIHIMPGDKPYYQGIEINNVYGEPNKPIVIDGHGVTLSGEGPLDPNQCQQISPGLWKYINPNSASNAGFVCRFYFILDGKMNRMGQCSKGPSEPFLTIDKLTEGQWTYVKDDDAFYFKLAASQSTSLVKVPVICNVVWIRGDSRYITLRNINTTHSWNDGFNFYDKISRIRLENVSAVECGDDGFSTHDQCEVELDGFFATRNATGICNTGTGFSSSKNILLYGNNGFEYYLFGPGRHIMEDSLIYADAVQPFYLQNIDPNGLCRLDVKNVTVINRRSLLKHLTLTEHTTMDAVNLVLSGVGIRHGGQSLALDNSKILGCPTPGIVVEPKSLWKASNNFYSVSGIQIQGKIYTPQTFVEYQKAAEDLTSRNVSCDDCKAVE